MESNKLANILKNFCLLQDHLKSKNLTEEEEYILGYTKEVLTALEEKVINHFLGLCDTYQQICDAEGVFPKFDVNGCPYSVEKDLSEPEKDLSAGVGMATAGLFNDLVGVPKMKVVMEEEDCDHFDDEELFITEEELEALEL